MKGHLILTAVACLLGLVSCAPQSGHATGGSIELIPKTGLLGSKGLRVRGHDLKPVNGRTKHRLDVENLPLSGSNWPYVAEIRFKDPESGEQLRLSPRQKQQTFVKLTVQDAHGTYHSSGSLADKWLAPDPGGYYYLNPSVGERPRAFYLSDEKGIVLEVEISMNRDFAKRVRCSVSMRTGGTK